MESKDNVNYVVRNARVKWAKVFNPDATFPPARWSINVYPGAIDAAALRKLGLLLRTDEKDGDEFFVAKRYTESKAGKKIDPPRVVDAHKKPFTEDIGNGSVCNVIVNVYPWEFGKKSGISAWLEAVQVVEHVAYVHAERVDFDDAPETVAASGANDNDLPF